jgi:hypothetical protein
MNLEILDNLWKSRYQNADFNDLNRLLEAFSRETTDLDARYQIDWRRARNCHFSAMQELEADKRKPAHRLFERGSDFTQWTIDEDLVEGRFWWAVNFLEAGRTSTKWSAYWALRGAKNQLETAAEIDETFHFAGPLRVLGRVAHLAPARLGGGLEAARKYYERALEIADNSTTRLYYAGLLEDIGDQKGAQTQIEAILDAPVDEDWRWEQERDRIKAQQWLVQSSK